MKFIKVFNFLFFICSMQVVFSNNLPFDFYYESGITSVTFDYAPGDYSTAMGDKLSVSTGKVNNGYQVTVTTNIDNNQKSSIYTGNEAVTYNSMFADSSRKSTTFHLVQLTATESGFSGNLDFWVGGSLYINNELVASDFTFGRNNSEYTGNSNWWIASNQGTIYQPGLAFDLQNADGSHHYCLRQDSSYEMLVTYGACADTDNLPDDWSHAKSTYLQLEYGEPSTSGYGGNPVKSLQFNYNQIYNDEHNGYDYLESVQSSYYFNKGSNAQGLKIVVTSKLDADSEPLSSFQSMFNTTTEMLEANSENVYMPSNLYFWIQGTLVIDGTDEVDDFTIARSKVGWEDRWWIASKNGISKKYQAKGKYAGTTISAMTLNGYCFAIHDASTTTFSTGDDYTFSVFEHDCDTVFN